MKSSKLNVLDFCCASALQDRELQQNLPACRASPEHLFPIRLTWRWRVKQRERNLARTPLPTNTSLRDALGESPPASTRGTSSSLCTTLLLVLLWFGGSRRSSLSTSNNSSSDSLNSAGTCAVWGASPTRVPLNPHLLTVRLGTLSSPRWSPWMGKQLGWPL